MMTPIPYWCGHAKTAMCDDDMETYRLVRWPERPRKRTTPTGGPDDGQ